MEGEVMNATILMAISEWAVKNLKIKESIKNVGTSVLQKCLWTPLENKIVNYFSSKENALQFVERVSTSDVVNVKKPERDVEDIYEELEGKEPSKELFNEIVGFLNENQSLIQQINQNDNRNTGTNMYIGSQNAEKIINNNNQGGVTIYM